MYKHLSYSIGIILLSLAFCFLAPVSHAQWNKVQFEGGIARSILESDSFLYMLNYQGVYKSKKDPVQWSKVNTQSIENVISFNNNDTRLFVNKDTIYLYTLNSNRICFSVDDAQTWASIPTNTNHFINSVFRFKNKLMLAVRATSTQAGDSLVLLERKANAWKTHNSIDTFYFTQVSRDTLFLYSLHNWYKSADGINFINVPTNNSLRTSYGNLWRYEGFYYGLSNNKTIEYSENSKDWTTLVTAPQGYFVQSFLLIDSIIYANYSGAFSNYIFKINIRTKEQTRIESLNTTFSAAAKLNGMIHLATRNGVYRFNNNWQYCMRGVNDPYVLQMNATDSALFVTSRDTVFRSINNGQTWEAMNDFSPQKEQLKLHRIYNKTYVLFEKKLFISTNEGKTFTTVEYDTLGINGIEFLGYDNTHIYLRGFTNANNFYIRTDGVSKSILNIEVFGSQIYPSFIYFDDDTLFAVGVYANFLYYSIDEGQTWNGYPFLNIIPAQYIVASGEEVLARPYVYCMSVTSASRPDIALIRKNNKWQKIPMYDAEIELPEVYISEGVCYVFRANRLLEYSLDTFTSVHKYDINFNIQAGATVNNICMQGNRVYAYTFTGGLWYNDITRPLQGIANTTQENSALIFPNPNEGVFNLKLLPNAEQYTKLEVYDLQGKYIRLLEFEENSKTLNSVDISDLLEGMYMLKLYTNNRVFNVKAVIKK